MMICIGIKVPLAVFAVMLQEQKRQQTSKHNNSTQKFSCDRAYPRLKTSMFQKSLSKGKLLWFLAPMDEKHCCCNFRIFSILSLVNWQRETSRLQHLFPNNWFILSVQEQPSCKGCLWMFCHPQSFGHMCLAGLDIDNTATECKIRTRSSYYRHQCTAISSWG